MALAGADGKRAADLLRRSKREGAAVLSNLARVAVTRLLERGSNALTAKRLFTDGERRVLADSVAATNATANLLGRARVRERMHQAQRRHEPEKLAELPPHVELFEEPKARDLKPLPPEKAVQYFRKLTPTVGIKDPPRFGQLMQRQAFTLAADADEVLLDKVKSVIQQRLETGQSVRAAPAEIEALLEAAGVAPKNPAYAEQVFRTNMMDSYTQGTQEELRDPDVADVFPVWKYLIVRDHRTRPHHAIHADQYFPNQVLFTEVRDSVKGGFDGYNCRCAQQPVSKWEWAELQRGGVAVSTFAERRPTQPFTVAVDLDGTLAEYDGWKGEDHFGALRPGAREALADLGRRSCRLIIFTTRGNTEKVRDWLEANRVPFDFINENPDQPPGSSGKVIADLYLDDRAVNAAGAWPAIHAAAVRRLELGTFAERPVPDLRQTTNYDCGAGALAAALAAFGLPVDVATLRKELGSNPSDGTCVNQLTEVAQQRSLGVAEHWGMDRGALQKALDSGALVLCPVQIHTAADTTTDRNGHYVLVTGLEGDQVVFHDPMRGDDGGRQTLPWADWLRGWHDYDTGGRYYHRCGLILTPPAERFCGGPGSGVPGPCPEGGNQEQPGSHTSLAAAAAWGEQHGVRMVTGESGIPVSRDQLNYINAQVAKIPPVALAAAQQVGSRLDVVGGRGITDHPSNAHLKGVTPRGWEGSGKTWDDVPGGSATKAGDATIIAARTMLNPTTHGSANLVLHEHAHTIDLSLAKTSNASTRLVSHQDDWKTIHAREKWGSEYETKFPEEAWAESFARMYHSTKTRQEVPASARDYFLKKFGDGQPHSAPAKMADSPARKTVLAPVFDAAGNIVGDIPVEQGEGPSAESLAAVRSQGDGVTEFCGGPGPGVVDQAYQARPVSGEED